MWGYHDAGWGGGWWIVMWLSMVIFWVFVAAALAWLVTSLRRSDQRNNESPERILARRLAAGEIDQAQYRALRDELRGHPHGPGAAVH